METVDFGILSMIPPVLTIILALSTREVISSLFVGILSGAAIYAVRVNAGFLGIFKIIFNLMAHALEKNMLIIIFISILGALIYVITMSGGTHAYGKWAANKIKSRRNVQLATAFLGFVMSIDDYFDCLAVGTVMKPISDKHKISRAKFAYIIDSMAAPVCVIAPMSSWAASISSCMDSAGLNGMVTFIKTIPYNFYAILTIILVVILACTKLDFGAMAKFEKNAIETGDIFTTEFRPENEELSKTEVSKNGKIIDLILPISILMATSIFMMAETGGFFEGVPLMQALGKGNSGLSITIGALFALVISFIMFIPRKLMSFKKFMGGVSKGVESMVVPFVILALAWTMSDTCQELLNTGNYIGDLVEASNIPFKFMPAIIFAASGFLSLSMGTSWGTFSILIPIVTMICQKTAPDMTVIALSATLAGAVFGDHCSPISDTMILSAAGAGCNHIDHVTTQIPYSVLIAVISFAGYITLGVTGSFIISFGAAVLGLIGCLGFLKYVKIKGKDLSNLFNKSKKN
ncbi:MAG: Na+/H+ antiporter NhaC family protein [Oscillospiraceae bacterium]|jgi:Na+/H+ antiporter NhaC|nr:Na+/H+ antiporter NhaC family protein [Oscillospiraceae bacterium]